MRPAPTRPIRLSADPTGLGPRRPMRHPAPPNGVPWEPPRPFDQDATGGTIAADDVVSIVRHLRAQLKYSPVRDDLAMLIHRLERLPLTTATRVVQ